MTYPEIVKRLYDLELLAWPPVPGERSGNFRSYDRSSRYDPEKESYVDWGANADGTGVVRMEGKDAVAAELDGPGVIWRIWSAQPQAGHLQFFIDGSDSPALDIPFEEYFNSRSGMFAYPQLVRELSRGKNSYIPIAFQKSCKVVLCEGWGRYYQITTPVAIPAGKTVEVFDHKTPGAVIGMWITPRFMGADPDQFLRELTISIHWDNESDASVWPPLGDFFATGPGVHRYRGLPMGVTQDGFYSKWYMPFNSARITIGNDGEEERTLEVLIQHTPLLEKADNLLRFHAKWHGDAFPGLDAERYLKGDRYPDWPMLVTRGAGRFCGVNLQVWNPNGFGKMRKGSIEDFAGYDENVTKYIDLMNRWWWGEGDEKFFVDYEKFPSTFGTGTEDYFGYAWAAYYPQTFESAFQNLSLCRGNCEEHVSQNRFQIADNVPFQRGFEACLEKYHPNHWPLRYHCIPFWYQESAGSDPYGPVSLEKRRAESE